MTCSRCSSPLLNQLQFDRGLCAMCLTGSSLSALVALAASHPADCEGLPKTWPSDTAWKLDTFTPTPEVQ